MLQDLWETLIRQDGSPTGTPIERQNARFAIDGAIDFGRRGIHKPPTEDHWLMPYWEIGAKLRALDQADAHKPRMRFSRVEQERIERLFTLRLRAIELLDIVNAEWKSDRMSVQCFDLRIVKEADSVLSELKSLDPFEGGLLT